MKVIQRFISLSHGRGQEGLQALSSPAQPISHFETTMHYALWLSRLFLFCEISLGVIQQRNNVLLHRKKNIKKIPWHNLKRACSMRDPVFRCEGLCITWPSSSMWWNVTELCYPVFHNWWHTGRLSRVSPYTRPALLRCICPINYWAQINCKKCQNPSLSLNYTPPPSPASSCYSNRRCTPEGFGLSEEGIHNSVIVTLPAAGRHHFSSGSVLVSSGASWHHGAKTYRANKDLPLCDSASTLAR